MKANIFLESLDNLIFSKRNHGGKIYQNYVGIGSETSKGKHLLLPSFNGNLTHTHQVQVWGPRSAKGMHGLREDNGSKGGHSMHEKGAIQEKGQSKKKCTFARRERADYIFTYEAWQELQSYMGACGHGQSLTLKAHGRSLSVGEGTDGGSIQAFYGSFTLE